MRKLAWFVIIVFGTILSIAVACAVSDPFKVTVSSMLNGVGGGLLATVGGWIQNMANIVSANLTNFAIYTCATLIAGGILWIGVKKLWAKRPAILQKQATSTTIANMKMQREPAEPEQTPTPTKIEEPAK